MSRREQAEWRRERLLDAALEVFVDKGFDRATVKDIAASAGVTPGLLYHYFESKDAVLMALLAERSFLAELRGLLASASERPAIDVLPELVRGYLQVLADNNGMVALFFGAGQTNGRVRQTMAEIITEGQRLLREYLDARVAAGELRTHDTALLASTLLTAVAAGERMGQRPDPDQVVDLFLNGALRRSSVQEGS
jgi:TetR/AcrR family transcriptional regulator, cholesterol catabolism regulator